jgi:hypothetical protein
MGFNSAFKGLIWWCGCIYYQVFASVCLLHCSEPDFDKIKMHGPTVEKKKCAEFLQFSFFVIIL